jgi:hypothetical protein
VTLSGYNIRDGDTLHLTLHLRGGKFRTRCRLLLLLLEGSSLGASCCAL